MPPEAFSVVLTQRRETFEIRVGGLQGDTVASRARGNDQIGGGNGDADRPCSSRELERISPDVCVDW